jgi:hypothetical protein
LVSAAGVEWTLVADFLEAPIAVVEDDEGGDRGGQFGAIAVSAAVDDLLFEGAVERSTTPLVSGSPTNAKLGIKP